MTGLFGTGVAAIAAVAVVGLAVVAVLVLPSGRAMVSALVGSVARLPALIRAELRGSAPLRVEGRPGDHPDEGDERRDTTPDIPVVTCGLPVVQRPGRV